MKINKLHSTNLNFRFTIFNHSNTIDYYSLYFNMYVVQICAECLLKSVNSEL